MTAGHASVDSESTGPVRVIVVDERSDGLVDAFKLQTRTRNYVGIYVIAFRQILQATILHWGIFIGPSLSSAGTFHNFVNRAAQAYSCEREESYTPHTLLSQDQFVIGHRVGEISIPVSLIFESKLNGMMPPPRSDCQLWVLIALKHLRSQLLGWIDVPPMAALRDHIPSREWPRGVFHSTVYSICNLEALDSADHSRIPIVDAGMYTSVFMLLLTCFNLSFNFPESLFPSISSVPPLTPTDSTSESSGDTSLRLDMNSTADIPALNSDSGPEKAVELAVAEWLQKVS